MSSGGRFWASLVKSTVAKAVLPSRLIWAAPLGPYGLRTAATDRAVATLPSIFSMRAWVAGSLTVPSAVWKTIVAESPACLGSAAVTRSSALLDSVFASVNEVE